MAQFNKLLKEQKEFLEEIIEKHLTVLRRNKKRFCKDIFQEEMQNEFNDYFKIGEVKPKEDNVVVDFISFIDKYISDRKELAEGTAQTLRGARKNIALAFGLVDPKIVKQWKAMNIRQRKLNPDFLITYKPLEFESINKRWMQDYYTFLLNATYKVNLNGVETQKAYSKNHIAKAIKIAKQFANAAADEGLITNLSYRSIKASWEEADTIALTWEEIYRLKAIEYDPHSIEGIVRNLFVFNCYCGLRYSDLNKLDDSKFTKVQGHIYIKLRMKKTDDIVTYPVLPGAIEIMKIYDYKMPSISEWIFNETIKKICLKADIIDLESKRETRGGVKLILTIPRYKMVSSHTGRRSFATNFEEIGVPIAELMAITGHTTEKAFRRYVKKRVATKFEGFRAAGAMV
jgi:hypothetical protein